MQVKIQSALVFFETSWIHYYNKEDSLLSSLDFPEFPGADFSNIEKSLIYLSTLSAIKPDQTMVASVTQKAGVLSIAECTKEALRSKILRCYFPPIVVPVSNGSGISVAYTRDSKVGFCNIDCDDDYIYALYSGRTQESPYEAFYCSYILVYDWEGNPVKCLFLEKPLFSMGYDRENNMIYGISYIPEGCVLEYSLNNVMER
jgi:hypothetical protein